MALLLTLGTSLGECQVNLKRQSRQSFGIDWYNDTAKTIPSDLTGVTMTIALGDRDNPHSVWVATNNANRSVWTLSEAQTDLSLIKYGGVLVMDDGSGEVLLFRVVAIVED
jgi:hypothetical protein